MSGEQRDDTYANLPVPRGYKFSGLTTMPRAQFDSVHFAATSMNWLQVLQIGLSYYSVWRNLIQEVESTSSKRGH
jgi:hypothetical protein